MSPQSYRHRMMRDPGGIWRVRLSRTRCEESGRGKKKDREAEAHIYTRRNCAAASRVTLCNLSTESRRDVISSCQGRGCACSSLPEIARRFFSLAFPSNQQRLRLQSLDERPGRKVNIYRCSGNIYTYIGLDRCSGKIMSDLFKKCLLHFLATCN